MTWLSITSYRTQHPGVVSPNIFPRTGVGALLFFPLIAKIDIRNKSIYACIICASNGLNAGVSAAFFNLGWVYAKSLRRTTIQSSGRPDLCMCDRCLLSMLRSHANKISFVDNCCRLSSPVCLRCVNTIFYVVFVGDRFKVKPVKPKPVLHSSGISRLFHFIICYRNALALRHTLLHLNL